MNSAIVVAAGSGSRIASDRPKQFLLLAGTPVLFHTLKPFEECDTIQEIIVVLPPESSAEFLEGAAKLGWKKVNRVVPGGLTRADSVKRGLEAVRKATAGIIAVHDGVRPFVSVEEITKTVAAAETHGAAILVSPVTDTIKRVKEDVITKTLARWELRRALTPQCFSYDLLVRAYSQANVTDPALTDDSVLVERLGFKVAIVEGSSRNIKITTAEDMLLAEALLRGT